MFKGEYHNESEYDEISEKHNKNNDRKDYEVLDAFSNYSYPLNKQILEKSKVVPKSGGSDPVFEYEEEDEEIPEINPDYFKKEVDSKIERLDKLTTKNKISKNLKTYTGLRFTPDKKMFLPAFTSASIYLDKAEEFAEGHPKGELHILEIHHKAGSNLHFLGRRSVESEVLIPRNQKIHIHKTEKIRPNTFLHKAERIDENEKYLKEDLDDLPNDVTEGTFYHGGANVPTKKLHNISFFAPKKEHAESYARGGSETNPKIHEVYLKNLHKPARDQDVIQGAKELGHYEDEFTPANHYLTHSVVPQDNVYDLIYHLKSKGFDHARLHDNDYDGNEFTSVMPFSPLEQIIHKD